MNWFSGNNGVDRKHRENTERLTRIETMIEMRGQQGVEVMKEFGAMREKLGSLHDDMVSIKTQMASLPARVTALEAHKAEIDALKNKAIGFTAVVGTPVIGISGWSLFEHIGSLISK